MPKILDLACMATNILACPCPFVDSSSLLLPTLTRSWATKILDSELVGGGEPGLKPNTPSNHLIVLVLLFLSLKQH
jgi:hypothetical protein